MSEAKEITPVIMTHSGNFHVDEVLACYLLSKTKQFKNAKIVRTRDKDLLKKATICVDVGGEYTPDKFMFDHHQKGFEETFSKEHTIKLSSAGLIYKHFGKEIIAKLCEGHDVSEKYLDILFLKVYDGFIKPIDAIDNGVAQYPGYEGEPNYSIRTHLSARVGQLNPMWNENNVDIRSRFDKAMKMAGSEFETCLSRKVNGWLPARKHVEQAVSNRLKIDKSGKIIHLEQFCSWKGHLYDLEEELKIEGEIKYVLYTGSGGKVRVQCVGVKGGHFESRIPLPEEWRGLRDENLSKKSGIEDCVFVHATGFIGGNLTYEGALAMAKKALKVCDKTKD